MHYLKAILLSIYLTLPVAVAAQNMQGTITDAASGTPMYFVRITNMRTSQTSVSDHNGFYTIPANTGETIEFSYIGYTSTRKAKPVSVLINTLNITMAPAANELKEFVLRPGRFTKYQADSAARKVLYKTTLERRPPSPFSSPVSAIAELFNQKAKRAYQFQKDFAAGEIEKFIDIRYNPQMVTRLTGLTGDSIGHFMYACPMPYDFARSATDLEIKMWVRSSFREWQKTQLKDSLAIRAEVKK